MEKLVSIICWCGGTKKQISNTIRSILQDGYASIEVLTDKSINSVVKKMHMTLPEDKISMKIVKGRTVTEFRNNAVEIARGQYIVFLTSPNTSSPERIKRQAEYLDCHLELCAVLGGETRINEKGEILTLPAFVETDPGYLPFAFDRGYQVSLDSIMFRKIAVMEKECLFRQEEADVDYIKRFVKKYPVSGIQYECVKLVTSLCPINKTEKNEKLMTTSASTEDGENISSIKVLKKRIAERNGLISKKRLKQQIRKQIDELTSKYSMESRIQGPLVSVVIPTFNRSDKIVKSIQSVLNQSYKNIEVIVVDDASSDSTSLVVSGLAETDSRIHYFCLPKNAGPAAARNYGVKKATGDYISFHDDDDEWFCDKLELQMSIMLPGDQIDMVFGQMARYRGKQLINIELSSFDWFNRKGDFFQEEIRNNYVGTPTVLIKKSKFIELNGFCEELRALEDWEFAIRASRQLKIEFINTPLIEVNVQESSVTTNVRENINALLYIIEHYYQCADNESVLMCLYRKHMMEILKKSADRNTEKEYLQQKIVGNVFTPNLAKELFFDLEELDCSERIEVSEKNRNNAIAELKKQYMRNKKLTEELWKQSERNDELTNELQNQCDRNESLTEELRKQSERNDELTNELQNQSDRNDQLTEELRKQSVRNDELMNELQNQSDRNDQLTEELRKQSVRNDELMNELQNQSDRNEALFNELKIQYTKNEDLTRKLQEKNTPQR